MSENVITNEQYFESIKGRFNNPNINHGIDVENGYFKHKACPYYRGVKGLHNSTSLCTKDQGCILQELQEYNLNARDKNFCNLDLMITQWQVKDDLLRKLIEKNKKQLEETVKV